MKFNQSATPDFRQRVPWNTGAKERGGLDIIWSCFAVIITCTWTALHLTVPPRSYGFRKKFVRKIKWSMVMIIFPEYVLAHAVVELKMALDNYIALAGLVTNGEFQSLWCVRPHWVARTLQHLLCIYSAPANAHLNRAAEGIVVADGQNSQHVCHLSCSRWTLTHSHFINMGGFVNYDSTVIHFPHMIQHKVQAGSEKPSDKCLHPVLDTQMTREHILDKSKASYFVKAIWGFQVLRLIVDVCIRASKSLPITQLEIIAISFSALSLSIWLIQLEKPQDVEQPIRLPGSFPRPQEDDKHPFPDPDITSMFRIIYWFSEDSETRKRLYGDHVPNDYIDLYNRNRSLAATTLCLSTLVFGSIHIAAWNFAFPTTGERWTWRVCALFGAIAPLSTPLFIMAQAAWAQISSVAGGIAHKKVAIFRYVQYARICFQIILQIIPSFLYVASRIILFALALASFRSAPRGIYVATWAKNIPSIS